MYCNTRFIVLYFFDFRQLAWIWKKCQLAKIEKIQYNTRHEKYKYKFGQYNTLYCIFFRIHVFCIPNNTRNTIWLQCIVANPVYKHFLEGTLSAPLLPRLKSKLNAHHFKDIAENLEGHGMVWSEKSQRLQHHLRCQVAGRARSTKPIL